MRKGYKRITIDIPEQYALMHIGIRHDENHIYKFEPQVEIDTDTEHLSYIPLHGSKNPRWVEESEDEYMEREFSS